MTPRGEGVGRGCCCGWPWDVVVCELGVGLWGGLGGVHAPGLHSPHAHECELHCGREGALGALRAYCACIALHACLH